MKNLFKKAVYTLLFLLLTACMLLYPKSSLSYALTGLTLWYDKMIPALLPFMILSNLIIGLHLTDSFVFLLKPLFGKLFCLNGHGIYAILVGFLCGFPMGAKVTADLYRRKLIQKDEAQCLLFFSNNIGPIYFTSFVMPMLPFQKTAALLFGMYGLPFLCGILLCHRVHSHPHLCAAVLPEKRQEGLLDILDEAVMSALLSIAKLGGYMVLFSLLNILPAIFLEKGAGFLLIPTGQDSVLSCAIGCLFEITSGISRTRGRYPLLILSLLHFGGFSCIAQTYSMIKGTDLSLRQYILQKSLLALLGTFYYAAVL